VKKSLFLLALVPLFLAGCGNSNSTNKSGIHASTALQKFSDQSYAANAYLISSEPLGADAQKAISGFQMTKLSMPDGTTQVTLKALEPQYHDQRYSLQTGDQLYFIDKFLADDSQNKETNINDDTAVVVNSQGYVVSGPSNFSP